MKKCTIHAAKGISISAFLLLFLFQGDNINANDSFLIEKVCIKSKVAFDTSSLRYIFLHAEEILSNPDAFWKNDRAYRVIKKLLTGLNRPIPYADWKNKISTITELSKEEREENRYYLLASELEEKADYFNSTAIPYVCSYFPKENELDISYTVYFTAYTGAYRTMYQNDLIIDVVHSRWGGSSKKILNNLVRVLFDVGYSKIRNFWTEKPLNKKIYRLLENMCIRGMGTYVGYKALHLFPAADIPEYTMLENPSDAARLRNSLNNIFSNAETMSEDDLRKSANKIGIGDKAYLVVGASMAKTIEEKLGHQGLIDILAKGPWSFLQAYNRLVKNNERIYEFKSDNSK